MEGSSSGVAVEQVTVVIAVRNGVPFVVEAVSSALSQGDVVAGVIVVDDNSTDNTRESIEMLADPRVSVIANAARGVSTARNAGLAAATAPWLLFLDADDRLVDGGVELLLAAANRVPFAVAAYGDHNRIDRNGRQNGSHLVSRLREKVLAKKRPSGDILARILRGNFIINGGCMIVARDACRQVGGFDPALSLCEDWHLWCRLAAVGPIAYTPESVMDYRVHSDSVMMGSIRRFKDFTPALHAIFSDPVILGKLPAQEIATIRRDAEVDLLTYCAAQAIRAGAARAATGMAVEAMLRRPARIPATMLRLGGALAGL